MSKEYNIQKIFKPWIVRRPDGGCQVLFPLTELDNICDQIQQAYGGEPPLVKDSLPVPAVHMYWHSDHSRPLCSANGTIQKNFNIEHDIEKVDCIKCRDRWDHFKHYY